MKNTQQQQLQKLFCHLFGRVAMVGIGKTFRIPDNILIYAGKRWIMMAFYRKKQRICAEQSLFLHWFFSLIQSAAFDCDEVAEVLTSNEKQTVNL